MTGCSLRLPLELVTDIFGRLEDRRALCASALVCRRLKTICQKALFRQITLVMPGCSHGSSYNTAAEHVNVLICFISQSPRLASYVTRVDIKLLGEPFEWVELLDTVAFILRRLISLSDLRLLGDTSFPGISWEGFPILFHFALVELIQDRLTRLCLENITYVPIDPLRESSLRHLSLSLASWDNDHSIPNIEPPTLQSLDITFRNSEDSLPEIGGLLCQNSSPDVCDLGSMCITIKVNLCEKDLSSIRKLLDKAARSLKHLWIHCDMEVDLVDFNLRPYPMLQTIGGRFSICFTATGTVQTDPAPSLSTMIPNARSTIAGVEFHIVLELVVSMADPHSSFEPLESWATLAKVLTPLPCQLTISIWSRHDFRIPDLISSFEGHFSEMRGQRRLTLSNMGSLHTDED